MKTLLKQVCLSAAIALCARFVGAEYLYCAIGNGSTAPTYYYNGQRAVYDYATVVMVSPDGASRSNYLEFYEGGATTPSSIAMTSDTTEPAYAKLPENYKTTYNTFLFELWTSGAELVAWQRFSLNEVQSGGHIVDGTGQGTALNVTTVVPEPTGGMLMLFGMVVLAMRRKTMMV